MSWYNNWKICNCFNISKHFLRESSFLVKWNMTYSTIIFCKHRQVSCVFPGILNKLNSVKAPASTQVIFFWMELSCLKVARQCKATRVDNVVLWFWSVTPDSSLYGMWCTFLWPRQVCFMLYSLTALVLITKKKLEVLITAMDWKNTVEFWSNHVFLSTALITAKLTQFKRSQPFIWIPRWS